MIVGVWGVTLLGPDPLRSACGNEDDWAGLFVMRLAMSERGDRCETITADEVGGMYVRHDCARRRLESAVGWVCCH